VGNLYGGIRFDVLEQTTGRGEAAGNAGLWMPTDMRRCRSMRRIRFS
jgi:hypothetical protein